MDFEDPAAPPATLWIIDAKSGHALSDGFAALLRAPELKAYQVPVKAAALDGAGRDALVRHGLPASPQWFLADARTDAVLARGAGLPKAEAFAQTLEQAGFRDRAKEMQAFLKRDPDSLEARDQLLRVLRARGEAAAMGFMGVEIESPRQRLEKNDLEAAIAPPPRPELGAAKPLDAVQDLQAWGAFTQELDADFRTGRWREMDMAWLGEARRLDAASPTLQGLYLRWMPTVEDALRQDPTSDPLWCLWAWMSDAASGRRLGPLLASLRPSPLVPRSEWPPQPALRMLLAAARTPEDWAALRTHYEALWEDEARFLWTQQSKVDLALIMDWSDCLGPLLECRLRTGASQQADALVRDAFASTHWPSLPAKASAIAARCGDKALAARWAAMK